MKIKISCKNQGTKKGNSIEKLNKVLSKLNEGKAIEGSLDSYSIIEVLLEDQDITDPEEADQLAIQRISQDQELLKSPGVNDLIKLGFIPVYSRRNYWKRVQRNGEVTGIEKVDAFGATLGEGAQGVVYEVTKGGKRYVAKIAQKHLTEAETEFLIRKRIEEIRSELPEEISRHIVQAFFIGETEDKNSYIYVMELLREMSEQEKEAYFYNPATTVTYDSLKHFFNDYENLYNILKAALINHEEFFLYGLEYDSMEKLKMYSIEALKFSILEGIEKIDFNTLRDKYNKIDNNAKISMINGVFANKLVETMFYNYFSKKEFRRFYSQEGFDIKEFKKDLINLFHETINKANIVGNMPSQYHDDVRSDSTAREEVQKLLRAMRYINDKYSLEWNDLHGLNVLVRPSTGELVAADVGLFHISQKNNDMPQFGPKNGIIGAPKKTREISRSTKDDRVPQKKSLKLEIKIRPKKTT